MSRLDALATVAEQWLTPTNALRQQAISALQVSTGFSRAILERALDAAFNAITREKLDAYLADRPINSTAKSNAIDLHITAGNVFTAWLHGAVISLLLGHRVWIKPSSHERVFPALWQQSLVALDSQWAEAVHLVTWDDALLKAADAIIAYGSDETLHTLKQKSGSKPFIGYGHKVSAGILFAEAGQTDADVLDALWHDVDAFDLQGCLSPQVIYVEGHSMLMEETLKKRKPSGPLPRWKSFQALKSVFHDLESVKKYLSCIGVAGSESQRADVEEHFRQSPEIRICKLGDMQRPPLDWRNGGIDLWEFFNRKNKL